MLIEYKVTVVNTVKSGDKVLKTVVLQGVTAESQLTINNLVNDTYFEMDKHFNIKIDPLSGKQTV